MRKWIGASALLVVLVACNSGAEPTTTTVADTPTTTVGATTTTTVVETTKTTTAAQTTTTAVDEPPLPDASGDDWTVIIRQLNDFAGWLAEHPDPSLVEYLAEPGSEYDQEFGGLIRQYAANGWRDLPGGRSEIVEVTPQGDDGRTAIVLVIEDYDGATTVDADGDVVKEDEDLPPIAYLATLNRNESQHWRFVSIENLGPIEGLEE